MGANARANSRTVNPVTYDPAQRVMIEKIREGATIRAAAGSVGIPESTWHRWRASVRDGTCDSADVIALVTDAMVAYDDRTAALEAIVVDAAGEDWKAAAWALDHRRTMTKAAADARRAQHEATIAKHRAEGTHVDRVSVDTPKTREELIAEARSIAAAIEADAPTKH